MSEEALNVLRDKRAELGSLASTSGRACPTPIDIALPIMTAKRLDTTDRALVRRVRWSVTECRKWMNAMGA